VRVVPKVEWNRFLTVSNGYSEEDVFGS